MRYAYSKEFAKRYGLREAVLLEYIRNKNKKNDPFVISYQGIVIAIPCMFTKNTVRHAIDHLRWLGFLKAVRSDRTDHAFAYSVTPKGRIYLEVLPSEE